MAAYRRHPALLASTLPLCHTPACSAAAAALIVLSTDKSIHTHTHKGIHPAYPKAAQADSTAIFAHATILRTRGDVGLFAGRAPSEGNMLVRAYCVPACTGRKCEGNMLKYKIQYEGNMPKYEYAYRAVKGTCAYAIQFSLME
jgi:hypothetical protein